LHQADPNNPQQFINFPFKTLKTGTAHLYNKDEKHGSKGCRAAFLTRNSELRTPESTYLARAYVTRQKKHRKIPRRSDAVVNKHQSIRNDIQCR